MDTRGRACSPDLKPVPFLDSWFPNSILLVKTTGSLSPATFARRHEVAHRNVNARDQRA